MNSPIRGRLAPSPTGLLHLGNAWAFLLAWLGARVPGGQIVLRMEDIDPDRSRPEWAAAIMEDLAWLGLDWDAGPANLETACTYLDQLGPFKQSVCGPWYEQAFAKLDAAGLLYPCYCTRKELRTLAGAPHGFSARSGGPGEEISDAGAPYSGTCRCLTPHERAEREQAGRRASWRFACPPEKALNATIAFDDAVLGPQIFTLTDCGGDFPLRRSDGVWSYQLAVTVDDARMGVNQVVRGEDILISTPRQISLLEHMGQKIPQYAHIPLLHDEGGERLAKRHQSLSIRALREAGTRPEDIIGALAAIALHTESRMDGFLPMGAITPTSPRELCARLQNEKASFPWDALRIYDTLLRVPDNIADVLRRAH